MGTNPTNFTGSARVCRVEGGYAHPGCAAIRAIGTCVTSRMTVGEMARSEGEDPPRLSLASLPNPTSVMCTPPLNADRTVGG